MSGSLGKEGRQDKPPARRQEAEGEAMELKRRSAFQGSGAERGESGKPAFRIALPMWIVVSGLQWQVQSHWVLL